MKKHFQRIVGRSREIAATAAERIQKPETPGEDVRITNETVAARREEVLRGARKFIYPIAVPRHRVLKLSITILAVTMVGFFTFCTLELYKFQSSSTFIYGVTQVVPFPVAVIGNRQIVSYNDYLFQLRRYMHFYQTQQHATFTGKDGLQLLSVLKQRSMDQALQNAYVEHLAHQYGVSVTDQDVDAAVNQVRVQNRLGASDDVFQSVLSEFWGWSVSDFRRELSQELLAQKVVDKLDTATHTRANNTLIQLQQSADFATLAQQVSDDAITKPKGGEYPALIDRTNADIAPQVMDALFSLQPGQYSNVINTGYTLEIVKVLEVKGTQVRAAHIAFNLQPITTYIKQVQASENTWRLIRV